MKPIPAFQLSDSIFVSHLFLVNDLSDVDTSSFRSVCQKFFLL